VFIFKRFGNILIIHEIYGQAPVQAEGTFDGTPFYFRARHNRWYIEVGHTVASAWVYGDTYKLGEAYAASYMEEKEAEKFIKQAYEAYVWKK
jgi:hypothetical protein